MEEFSMKNFKKLSVLLLAGMLACGFAACGGTSGTSENSGNSGNSENSQTSDNGTSDSGSDEVTEYSSPVITVTPEVVEIYQGGEVELLFGVEVSDEYDAELTATIQDDDGFDVDVVGEYTITYVATNSKGKSSTATRTIKVLAPLAQLVLEAQKAIDTKWADGAYLKFAHDDFITLTEDTTYTSYMDGVFYNASDETIVVDVPGGGGQAAIVTANGIVIEGRDGSNGRLMNAENPQRVGSTATTFTYNNESYSVANDFARYMQIPAKGYAVVVTVDMFGTGGFDYDGRSFINKNVLYQYGTAVSLYWADDVENPLTTYVDRGPTVTPPSKIELATNSATVEEINAKVLEGLTITDDNGTFNLSDDVTSGFRAEIVSNGDINVAQAGTYIYKLEVEDGQGNVTEFTRVVELVDAAMADLYIGESKFTCIADKISIDQEVSATTAGAGTYAFLVYTPAYKGDVSINGWGIAIVLDKNYKVARIYDGAWNRYFDAMQLANDATVTATKLGQGTYANDAFKSLSDGETLIVAPNGGDNNGTGGSRSFLKGLVDAQANGNGEAVTIGLEFQLAGVSTGNVTVGTNSKEFKKNTIIVNETVADYSKVNFVVYTKEFTGTITATDFGEAFILDEWGTIVRIYDGANGKYYDSANPSGVVDKTICTAAGYLTEAFNSLQEGETLLCAPNGGLNSNEARAFLLSNRTYGASVSIPGIAFKKTTLAIDGVETELNRGRLAVNKVLTAYTAYDIVVWDYAFKQENATITNQGWGEAIVIDAATGKILRGYDGIAAKYYDADNAGGSATGCTAGNYITEAYNSLGEGEILIVGVNNGGAQVGRSLIAGYVKKIGSVITMGNIL